MTTLPTRQSVKRIVLAVGLLILAGCGGGSVGGPPPPTKTVSNVTLSCAPLSILVGATSNCTAVVTYSVGPSDGNVTLTSDNANVAAVQSSTAVKGMSPGTANITATATWDSKTKSNAVQITVTPAKTVTSVTLSCNPTTIAVGGTSACTPIVNYSDGTHDSAATLASDNTSVATVSGTTVTGITAGTANITATATWDGKTKSNAVQITVNPAPGPVISGISEFAVFCNAECFGNKIVITGSNFLKTDLLHVTPGLSGGSVVVFVSSTEMDLYAGFDSPTYNLGQFTLIVSRSDGSDPSNPFAFGLKDNRNMVGRSSTGDFFQLDMGTVHHYAADGTHVADFPASGWGRAIAVDDLTGTIVIAQRAGAALVTYDANGNSINGDGNVATGYTGVDAANGVACVLRSDVVDCLDLTNPNATPVSTAAGTVNDSCSVQMGQIGAELDALVYSCGNGQITRINTATIKVSGTPLQLTGITLEPSATARAHLILFPAQNRLAFVDPTDTQVMFIDPTSMTLKKTVALTGTVYFAFADQAQGKLVVVYNPDLAGMAGSQAVPVRIISVDIVNGKVTQLTDPPADILPTGGRVSLDGKSIALGERGRLVLTPNQ
jgi:hypothetical protein